MSITVDQLYQQALSLPMDSRESLVEKLVLSIEANVDPDIEHAHVQEAIRRRDEVRSGTVQPVPGDKALKQVRSTIEK